MHSVAMKKSRKHSGFVIYSSCKYSAFTAVKMDEKVLTRYMKGVSFVNRRHMKGAEYLFCEKLMVYKRVRGWTSGRSLPVSNVF